MLQVGLGLLAVNWGIFSACAEGSRRRLEAAEPPTPTAGCVIAPGAAAPPRPAPPCPAGTPQSVSPVWVLPGALGDKSVFSGSVGGARHRLSWQEPVPSAAVISGLPQVQAGSACNNDVAFFGENLSFSTLVNGVVFLSPAFQGRVGVEVSWEGLGGAALRPLVGGC